MKQLYFSFLEWLLYKIEKRIYPEEYRREQLKQEIIDLNEMLDDYRYNEYMEEMRDSTWRY